MKLSKFKLSVNYAKLEKPDLKSINAGSVPDCEVIWVPSDPRYPKSNLIPVCVEDYQPGSCLGGGPI